MDGSGNAYVTGYTLSSNFPTQNPFQTDQSYYDAFVTALSSSGNSLIYSTYLGGVDYDWGLSIAVDASNNAYVTGWTQSSDFPTQNPFQTYPGGDAFVTALSSSGSSLIYSTYLGGGSAWGFGIAVDGSGNAYVTGVTFSFAFPVQDPYQSTFQGGRDAFVTKLGNFGNSLIYSTYLGGTSWEQGQGIAVDGNGNAYVTGWTQSTDFPTVHSYQTYQGPAGFSDAFVTKLSTYLIGDADGNRLVNISDVVYLIAYVFSGGPAPSPEAAGDVDCNGIVNISDVVYLIAYIFNGSPAPCAACK